MKFMDKPNKSNVWVFHLYLVQMNPGDVLVIGEWTLLELGNVRFFRNFSKCQKWNYREKPEKINFWVFQLYLVQMSPGDVLVIEEWTLLKLGNVRFFRNFSKCQKWNLRKKPKKNQFLSSPTICSSNEPRGRASYWEMNTSGIGQFQMFWNFSIFRKWNYQKKPKNINFWIF